MSARREVPTRFVVFGLVVLAVLGGTVLFAAKREHSALPDAAKNLVLANQSASEITVCLEGVQDELFIPGRTQRTPTRVATNAALTRLRECDVSTLDKAVARVDLPPAPPLIDDKRRRARSDIAQAVALLDRVVLDTRGAARAMNEDIATARSGSAVVLAYRSAAAGTQEAYALTLRALDLLGESQSAGG